MRAGLCALFCLVGSVGEGFAGNIPGLTDEHIAKYEAMDEAARVKILIQLAKGGAESQAEQLLAAYPLSGPHARNRTLFIEGLIFNARSNHPAAAKKFRDALASDPKLTLVRSELAQTLVLMHEDDSAKHHLRLLEGDTDNAQDAAGIRAFIDRIDARRPYGFSAYASVAPSTNINNGSGQSTVYSPIFGSEVPIDDASKAKQGYSISTGVSGSYNFRLSNDYAVIAAGGIDTRIYDDLDFNAISISQSLELRRFFENGYLGLGAVASQSIDTDELEMTSLSYGPRISAQLRLTTKDSVSGSSTYEFRDFNADGSHDGTSWTSDLAWSHGFSSDLTSTVYGGFDTIDNGVGFLSYDTVAGGLQVYREFSHGISVTATGEARFTSFDGVNPLAGVTRVDRRLIGGVTLTKRDLNFFGFAPALNYTYVNNASNISLYDYDSHSLDFRLTKDF